MSWTLAIVAVAILGVAAVSRRISATPVMPAMLFVAIGVLAGPRVLGEFDASPLSTSIRTLAEATLTIVLFADAARIDLHALRRDHGLPLRLLAIGLPLTIVAGAAGAALLLDELTLLEALVLGVLLAPTDAALGPAAGAPGHGAESPAAVVVLEEIGYAIAGGAVAGACCAAVVLVAGRRGLIADSWIQIIPVAGPALAYGLAAPLGGSGFIAAFVAGLCFGGLLGRDPGSLATNNEQLGDLLNGVTFIAFGAVLLGPALGELSWELAAYAVLSLTLVRMAPVAIALLDSGARRQTVAFAGWCGPRGLASIVFAVLVLEAGTLAHTDTLLLATYATVGLSLLAHGVSAAPLAERFARWYERHPHDRRPTMESRPVATQRPRAPVALPASAHLGAIAVAAEPPKQLVG